MNTPTPEEAARSAVEQIDACRGVEVWNAQDKHEAKSIILAAFAPLLAEKDAEIAPDTGDDSLCNVRRLRAAIDAARKENKPMNTPNDGGPAFPSATPATKKLYQPTGQVYGEEQLLQYYGMSLRDWFAGSVAVTQKEILDYLGVNETGTMMESLKLRISAEVAVRWMKADAMIAARQEGSK